MKNSIELQEPNDIKLAIDAEWDSEKDLPLCFTISIQESAQGIYLNNDIGNHLDTETFEKIKKATFNWGISKEVQVYWQSFNDDNNLVEHFLEENEVEPNNVKLRMFYSPKDVTLGFGFNNVESHYKAKKQGITQKRNVSGYRIPISTKLVSFHDLKGWASIGGLKDLASSVGHEMKDKGLMDSYKSRMLDGLVQETEAFLDYAMGDTVSLHSIHDLFVDKVKNEIAKKVLGVELVGDLPHTVGSILARTFEAWILSLDKSPAFQLALKKLGILDTTSKNYRKNRNLYNQVFKKIRSAEQANNPDETTSEQIGKLVSEIDFTELAYSQGSVRHLGKFADSRAFNALVQGGRCINERPTAYTMGVGADIDLKSCYGTALANFTYFIGLPSLFGYTENEDTITVREWLKQWKSELVDGCWTLTVEGEVNFEQDLLFSKVVTQREINTACSGSFEKETTDSSRDDDLAHIPGVFMLPRKKLENSIITSDIWQAIEKVATNTELKGFYDLKVVAAAVYKASDRCDTTSEWADKVLADKGTREVVQGSAGATRDDRTTAWIGISIGNFINPLVEKRGLIKESLKSEKSKDAVDETKLRELEGLDSMLKLFVNTLYGVLVSPYFMIGNTVVGNNITARARLGAWMMNKALHTRQSITDGGMYSPVKVPFLSNNDRLPGFEILSDNLKWIDRRRLNRTLNSLGGIDWTEKIKEGMTKKECIELGKLLDKEALTHINDFWDNYGLELPFNIEHKGENTFVRAAYWGKAHYAFDLCTPQSSRYTDYESTTRLFRIRGCRKFTDGKKMSPIYQLLANILDGSDEMPQDFTYHHFYLLKIGKWLEAQLSKGYENLDGKRPGDEVVENRILHLNNTHFFFNNSQEHTKKFSRKVSKMIKGQKINVQLFEKYSEEGITYVHKMMGLDKL